MFERGVQRLVQAHFVIEKVDFFAVFDGFVYDVDIVKEVFVVRFAPILDGIHVLDVALEVMPSDRDELVYELLGVRGVDVAGCKHAVYEQSKLGIFKFARGKIRAFLGTFYIETHFFEARDIAPDRLAFALYAVISVKFFDYVLMRERMLEIAVLFEYLIYAEY